MGSGILKKWWWVGLFCCLCGGVYLHAIQDKRAQIEELSFRLQEIEKEKVLSEMTRDELRLQIASQEDPAWIEMVLMRDLGLVPEGWLKVHFKNVSQSSKVE